MSAEERARVVQEALSWCGTAYHHHARIKGAGVDCGMLLAEVYHAAGMMPYLDPGPYVADWHHHRSEERYLAQVERAAHRIAGPPQPGDIALYRWGRCISHGAIIVAWPQVVHAYTKAGSVVLDDAVANKDLESRFVGFWSCWED